MKRGWVLLVLVTVIGFAGAASATLTTIGTATYGGNNHNLIYEDNSIYGGLVWLDYRSAQNDWSHQVSWASGLNAAGVLTYTLDPGVSVTWDGAWRLPSTDESKADLTGPWGTNVGDGSGRGWGGPDASGNYDYFYGYNMVNSEMGHLYYTSLGNKGYYATDGTNPQVGWGLQKTGPFNNFTDAVYWSGTEYSPNTGFAWLFGFNDGSQGHNDKGYGGHALAVRPGEVSAVPEPATVLLLVTGLAGLGAYRKRIGRRRG